MARQYNLNPWWSSDPEYQYSATGSFFTEPIYLEDGYGFSVHAIASNDGPSGSFALSGSGEIWKNQGITDAPSHFIGLSNNAGTEARFSFNTQTTHGIITQTPAGVPWVIGQFIAAPGSSGFIKVIVTVKGVV